MALKIIFNETPRSSWQLFRNRLLSPIGRSYLNNELLGQTSLSNVAKNPVRITGHTISLLNDRLVEAGVKELCLDEVSTFTIGRTINEILTSRNMAEAAHKLGKSNFDAQITQLPTGETQLSVELSRPDFFHLRNELSPRLEFFDIGCATGIITGLSGIIGGGILGNKLGSDNNYGFNPITSLLGSVLGSIIIPFTYNKIQDLMRIGMDTVKCSFQFPALMRIQNEAFGSISETDFKRASLLLNAVTTATALELSRLWNSSPEKAVKIAEVSGGFNAKIAVLSNPRTDLLALIPYLNDANEKIRIKAVSSILERKPTADLIRAMAKDSQSKPEIHQAISQYKGTPEDVFGYYLTQSDDDFVIRECVSRIIRPGIRPDDIRRFSRSPHSQVQRAIAEFDETPADVLEQYLDEGKYLGYVVPRIIKAGISPNNLRRFSESPFYDVQSAVAHLAETPKGILEAYLMEEKALKIVLPRLYPKNASAEQLRDLSIRKNYEIQWFLVNHEQTPRDVLISCLDDSNHNTSLTAAKRLLSDDCNLDLLLKFSKIFADGCGNFCNLSFYWKVVEIARRKDCEPNVIAQLLSDMPNAFYYHDCGYGERKFEEAKKIAEFIKTYPEEKQTEILAALATLNPVRSKEVLNSSKTSKSLWPLFSRRP